MAQINSLQEMCESLGVPDFEAFKKAVYKGTDCGAWVREIPGGLQIGSIVEGSDAETQTYKFHYPFEYGEFWKAMDEVEIEADILWRQANEGEEVVDSDADYDDLVKNGVLF